jgi:uncharacterized membrane-anchored protein YjiN (DUF445 family)
MTRRSDRKALSPEVYAAFVTLIEGVLRNQMKGMLKAKDVEEHYLKLLDRIRDATDHETATIARKAAEYIVARLDSDPPSKSQVDRLKKAAFDHALKS